MVNKVSGIGMAGLLVAAVLLGIAASVAAADKPIELKLGTSAPANKITLSSIEGAGLSSEHTVTPID